jgi:hypothetical protein
MIALKLILICKSNLHKGLYIEQYALKLLDRISFKNIDRAKRVSKKLLKLDKKRFYEQPSDELSKNKMREVEATVRYCLNL